MSASICLAIDAMGGDVGPRVTLPATHSLALQYPSVKFTVFGDLSSCQDYFRSVQAVENITVVAAQETIAMDESPATALRHKRCSSMGLALKAVAEGEAAACVSAGNTGALVALGCHFLGTVDGINRPAIGKHIPTANGRDTYMLDLGANVGCSSDQLVQFARLGAALVKAVSAVETPSVSLLNIGLESNKGKDIIRTAAAELEQIKRLNYCGYIEGDSIYKGQTDVIVCDGFTGNVALKTSEGLARFLKKSIKKHYNSSIYGRLVGFLSKPVWRELSLKMDPGRYNGASLLGLKGTVIKSHGGVGETEFAQAIAMTIPLAKNQGDQAMAKQFEFFVK